MTGPADWIEDALVGSTVLMVFVLTMRGPVRRWVGPRLGYALWALPVLRMLMPPLRANLFATPTLGAERLTLAVGPHGAGPWQAPSRYRRASSRCCLPCG